MFIMGILSCGAMWLLAPLLAAGDARMIPVFRSLAWPLLLIPSLSLIRGFFQGYNEMAPSAISQFIEQVARILYMLVMTYAIMVAGNHDYLNAVVHSTFAAFIGQFLDLAYWSCILFGRNRDWILWWHTVNRRSISALTKF